LHEDLSAALLAGGVLILFGLLATQVATDRRSGSKA